MPQEDTNHRVVAIGCMPDKLRRACFRASEEAGLAPAYFVLIDQTNAVVVTESWSEELFVRVVYGKRLSTKTLTWTRHPDLIRKDWLSYSKSKVRKLLADPRTKRKSYPIKDAQ